MLTAEQHVNAFADSLHGQWPGSDPVWVAFSGGLDSTVLLMACRAAGWRVHAIHVNHNLQDAAGAMQAHCEQWCERFDIPLTVLQVSIERNGGDSLEANARHARYAAIGQRVAQQGGTRVLTAHHADDQIETVLLTLLRGSGLEGLAGMSMRSPWPVAGYDTLQVGRPLLGALRADLLAQAQANAWHWFEDPTNSDPLFRRNWLRSQALPMLREQFPQVDASLLRLARQVGDARDEWRAQAKGLLAACSDADGTLSRDEWLKLSDRQQVRVLRYWLAQSGVRPNELQTLELHAQLQRPQGGMRRVCAGWSVRVSKGKLGIHFDEQGGHACG